MKRFMTLLALAAALSAGCSTKDTYTDTIKGLEEPFEIVRPSAKALKAVHSTEFGMDPTSEDNSEAFSKALGYLQENPGTKLILDKGTYRFSESGRIVLKDINKCLIDGSDARFIFCKQGLFFQIKSCDTLEIKGLTIDIDRVGNPLEDIVEVRNVSVEDNTIEFEFFNKQEVPDSVYIQALSICDPDDYTYGLTYPGKRAEAYTYQNPGNIFKIDKVEPNVLRIHYKKKLEKLEKGDKVILRYHVYDGQVFSINGESSNLTFNGLKIYGGYGCGFVVGELTNHYQIINTTIGVDPQDNTKAQCSIGADGVHIAGSGGYFLMEGCDISRQGDDAINIHDGIAYIYQVDSNKVRVFSTQTRLKEGETLAFKDSSFNNIGLEAVIVSCAAINDGPGARKEIVLDKSVDDIVKPGSIAYSKATDSGHYIIRNNYFHENRARGLLLQSDNGLCENNRFYKVQGQAIKIVMDILPVHWQEGTGVSNLTIRNNIFDKCDKSGWGEQITINTNIDGHRAQGTVFRSIRILDNTFTGVSREVIDAMNVDSLIFKGNTIEKTDVCKEQSIRLRDFCTNCDIDKEL